MNLNQLIVSGSIKNRQISDKMQLRASKKRIVLKHGFESHQVLMPLEAHVVNDQKNIQNESIK